jgi:endonuclease/exonuclease/phosphatase family metal-dependent hydrolase
MLYNIRYATGIHHRHSLFSGYMGRTQDHLEKLIHFIEPYAPDILGLVEVDEGSFRTGRRNQAQQIAERLGHYHVYRSKYKELGLVNRFPVISKQGNAFLSKDTICHERFHYFNRGIKRMVIELELDNLAVFLVHLSLRAKVRHQQLGELYALVKSCRKPAVVAGDFNALWGENEIDLFLAASGLKNPNRDSLPSFPSWKPRRHLDFILHSPEIETRRFEVPSIMLSDHLPLVWDFEVR